MKPTMYIFLNKGAGMSAPKMAAQSAHAAVEAYREQSMSSNRKDTELLEEWYVGGHYTKIVLEARDEQHLFNIRSYLGARGFDSVLIIDEGRTEVAPHTATALGCWVVDKDDPHTAATFGAFKLYREEKPKEPERTDTIKFDYIDSSFDPSLYRNIPTDVLPPYSRTDAEATRKWFASCPPTFGEDGDLYCVLCEDKPPYCTGCRPRRRADWRVDENGNCW